MRDARTGYVNQNGTQGALRRDETDRASSRAPTPSSTGPCTRLALGRRPARQPVRLSIDDHYITAASPDDSGSATYRRVNPVLGVVWHALDSLNLYANLGRGLETPTLTEVAYGPRQQRQPGAAAIHQPPGRARPQVAARHPAARSDGVRRRQP